MQEKRDERGLLRGELVFIFWLFPHCSPDITEMLCLPHGKVTSPHGISPYVPFLPPLIRQNDLFLSSHGLCKQRHTLIRELLALPLPLTALNTCLVGLCVLPVLLPSTVPSQGHLLMAGSACTVCTILKLDCTFQLGSCKVLEQKAL